MAALTEPRPERPRGMHRRTYARSLQRLESYESRLSPRQKGKPVDYPNLVHYLNPHPLLAVDVECTHPLLAANHPEGVGSLACNYLRSSPRRGLKLLAIIFDRLLEGD
jgi:hypothetical protein